MCRRLLRELGGDLRVKMTWGDDFGSGEIGLWMLGDKPLLLGGDCGAEEMT